MFIPDPGSWFLPIPDPKTSTKERGEKIFCHNILCSHKFLKIANYFSFGVLKKKIWANFQRIIEFFTQKIVTKLLKIWVWDPGSGKNLFWIPDPGSRGQKGTGSRIPDPDPQHGSPRYTRTEGNLIKIWDTIWKAPLSYWEVLFSA